MRRNKVCAIALTVILSAIVGCASKQTPTSAPFQAVQLNPATYAKKVDTFFIVEDASSSMNDEYSAKPKIDLARDLISHMNQTIPPLDYKSGMVAFGSGSCLDRQDSKLLYPIAPYKRSDFAASLEKLKCAGGVSPMSEGIAASHAQVKGTPGQVALIIISDAKDIYGTGAIENTRKIKAEFGNRLCVYPIQIARDADGRKLMDELATVGGCGFAVNADDISSPNAMADYVTKVFLASAPARPAPVASKPDIDSDGDGVPDSRDKCPGTPRGVKVNAQGCWELKGVYFDTDKAIIKDARALDEAAVILKANPRITGEIRGYTDSTASEAHNQKLSEARAKAVRDYFINHGIAAGRLRAKGFGETDPVASNDTAAGRALNRRVELHPDNF